MWMPCELDFDSAFGDTLKAQEARRPRSAASGPRSVGYVLSNFNPSGPVTDRNFGRTVDASKPLFVFTPDGSVPERFGVAFVGAPPVVSEIPDGHGVGVFVLVGFGHAHPAPGAIDVAFADDWRFAGTEYFARADEKRIKLCSFICRRDLATCCSRFQLQVYVFPDHDRARDWGNTLGIVLESNGIILFLLSAGNIFQPDAAEQVPGSVGSL